VKETAVNKIPYAEDSDAPDYPTQGKALAERLDLIVPQFASKVIASEQSLTNKSEYTPMGTADEVTGLIVPENGVLLIAYLASIKSSSNEVNATACLFIDGTALSIGGSGSIAAVSTKSTAFLALSSDALTGLAISDLSRGTFASKPAQLVSSSAVAGTGGAGLAAVVFKEAGTHTVLVQFKCATATVTVKERRLAAWVMGHS
jgi:hypothetical protein